MPIADRLVVACIVVPETKQCRIDLFLLMSTDLVKAVGNGANTSVLGTFKFSTGPERPWIFIGWPLRESLECFIGD
jgi:hypothetical protein